MNRLLLPGLILLGFVLIVPGAVLSQPVFRGCYDGDTCYFDLPDRANAPVRIMGVDTPERKTPGCAWEKVTAATAKSFTETTLRLNQGAVLLERHGKDKYGRELAKVFVGGNNLADLLIAKGLGRPYSGGKRQGWCGGAQ